MSEGSESTSLWGGRFADAPEELFRAVNDSLPIDWRLVREDITGSLAWSSALERAGLLTPDERIAMHDALSRLLDEVSARESTGDPHDVWGRLGLVPPPVKTGAEDVHTWVEQRLTERLGDVGRKLHTGRSRNDQVATDLRLWTRGACARRRREASSLISGLLDLAARYQDAAMPGYTHLQRAQPVLISHWCLAHAEALRHADRLFAHTDETCRELPLGCGALAGTGYTIDREALCADLDATPMRNSIDAVSSRAFVLDAVHACESCALSLSRLAEELVVWCSGEFAFVTLEDSMTSGSSLMPQKKNPDALELVRAKAGLVLGARTALAAVMKSLPLGYNKDTQEDKRLVFAAMDDVSLCLRVLARLIAGVVFDTERCRRAAAEGFSNATDLADELVARGVPFRTAHDQTGRAVRRAIELDATLEDMPPEELGTICPELGSAHEVASIQASLTVEAGLRRRAALGGTAPSRVEEELARARRELEHRTILKQPVGRPVIDLQHSDQRRRRDPIAAGFDLGR